MTEQKKLMKKINAIETISLADQQIIKQWYRTTIRLLILLALVLTIFTISTLAYQRLYGAPCKVRVNANATALQKKHASDQANQKQQKQIVHEKTMNNKLITQYQTLIASHATANNNAHLLELQLQQTTIKARYTIARQADMQQCIEQLRASPALEQVRFESLEQSKAQSQQTICTLTARWKKE